MCLSKWRRWPTILIFRYLFSCNCYMWKCIDLWVEEFLVKTILMSQIPHSRTPLLLHWILKTPQLVNKTSRQAMRLNLKPVSTEISSLVAWMVSLLIFGSLIFTPSLPRPILARIRTDISIQHAGGIVPAIRSTLPFLPAGGVHPDRVHPDGWIKLMDECMGVGVDGQTSGVFLIHIHCSLIAPFSLCSWSNVL
jgi:hypothetical protein